MSRLLGLESVKTSTAMPSPKTLLSPHELAQAIGVSESSVKRWVDDGLIRAARTAGGHRRIPVREAVRFVRESDAVLLRPEVLGLDELRGVEAGGAGQEEARFYDLLAAGAAPEAVGLLVSLYLDGWGVARVLDGPVRSALERLGELWRHDQAGIFLEHRAVPVVLRALVRLRELLPEVPEGAPRAVGCAPSGDPYLLPSLGAAMVLEAEGLAATNLGPETPVATLETAVRELRPRLVWLSASAPGAPEGLGRELRGLLQRLTGEGGREAPLLVLGGRRAGEVPLAPHPRLHRGETMAELAALGKGITGAGAA